MFKDIAPFSIFQNEMQKLKYSWPPVSLKLVSNKQVQIAVLKNKYWSCQFDMLKILHKLSSHEAITFIHTQLPTSFLPFNLQALHCSFLSVRLTS